MNRANCELQIPNEPIGCRPTILIGEGRKLLFVSRRETGEPRKVGRCRGVSDSQICGSVFGPIEPSIDMLKKLHHQDEGGGEQCDQHPVEKLHRRDP